MSAPVPRRPGGQMGSRPLPFIWLADSSGSMRVDGKIQALNNAIREAIPHMRTAAAENPHASVQVQAMAFGDEARWLDEQPLSVQEYQWHDLEAGGLSSLGAALALLGDTLGPSSLTERSLPPIIALVTDGLPTDDFQAGFDYLMSKPWGRQALRVVVAIGEDAASQEAQHIFRTFGANDLLRPLQANNPEALVEHIRWVATAVVESVAAPPSQFARNTTITRLSPAPLTASVADVW